MINKIEKQIKLISKDDYIHTHAKAGYLIAYRNCLVWAKELEQELIKKADSAYNIHVIRTAFNGELKNDK